MPGYDGFHGIDDNECTIAIGKVYLVFPKYPQNCHRIRIVDRHTLKEIAMWNYDEWALEPEEVMGAIMGSLCEGLKGFIPSPIHP